MPAPARPRLLAAPARLLAITAAITAAITLALLGACASPAPVPLHLHSLGSVALPSGTPPGSAAPALSAAAPAAAPATASATTSAAAPATAPTTASDTWQLLAVQLPAYLDRDALLVPATSGGLQALAGERWAEPLRDAVPRLLRDDLARLRGAASVWAAPLPAGLLVQRQLRVELLALDVLPGRSAVRLRARWWLADVAPAAGMPATPLLGEADLQTQVAGTDAAALVAAHRALLWQLAGCISAGSSATKRNASTAPG